MRVRSLLGLTRIYEALSVGERWETRGLQRSAQVHPWLP